MDFDLSELQIEAYAVAWGGALLILLVGWLVAGWVGASVRRAAERSGRFSPTLIPLFAKLTRLTLLLVVVLAALEKVGVETAGLFAMIGAAGLAIGLALKDTVSDVAAGVVLLILRPFDVGETIEVGGVVGTVTEIDLFQTKLTRIDGVPIFMNNSSVRGAVICNFARAKTRRTDLEIGIGYGDDIGKAKQTIADVLATDSRILDDPAVLINVSSLGDSAVVLLVRYHTAAADFFDTKLDVTRAIKEALDRGGISIPFPQRDLHIVDGKLA